MSASTEWMKAAACDGLPTDWFFVEPEVDRGPKAQMAKVKKAKAICAQCPVQHACGEWAIETVTDDGIWGGMTPAERIELRGWAPGGRRTA